MAIIDTSLDLTPRDTRSQRNVSAADWFGESLSALAPAFLPSLLARAWLGTEAWLLGLQRRMADKAAPPRRLAKGDAALFPVRSAQARLRLWTDPALVDEELQIRKVHNLYLAANELDRVIVRKDEVFSFWTQLGCPSKARGYVQGRIFRNGRMEKKPGIGLSQLSSALYDASLQEGCEILERHERAMRAPGSDIAPSVDTMVAWNFADLRFRANRDVMLRVTFERGSLFVRMMATPLP
jgi:vancomycin resistance protein VanW